MKEKKKTERKKFIAMAWKGSWPMNEKNKKEKKKFLMIMVEEEYQIEQDFFPRRRRRRRKRERERERDRNSKKKKREEVYYDNGGRGMLDLAGFLFKKKRK